MIVEYQRPTTIDEALRLLGRAEPLTLPMGGGTVLNQVSQSGPQAVAVVDLQALGLNKVEQRGKMLRLGATVTLQALLDHPGLPAMLYEVLRQEATHNLRQAATLAGTLVAADGRSPLAVAMLALDAVLTVRGPGEGDAEQRVGDWLPLRLAQPSGRLITMVTIPTNVRLAYEYVARTPADRPIVCAALVQWPSGRTRLALGGWGSAPLLALDGPEPGGLEAAAQNAYSQAGDQWASAAYRCAMAATLAKRCLG
jgi:CO/xanthine dehydrogenase FAD-binding subunit